MNALKSIGAILAGIVFVIITHSGTDFILESLGVFTPRTQRFDTTWMVVTATVYRTLFSIAGAFVTAMLAPSRPMLHAMIFGGIGLLMGAIAAVVTIPMDLGPAWYPIALAVLAPFCGWLGGRLYTARVR